MTLLPLTNPVKTAEEYAMLDVLSGGQFDFGVGRGILRDEYDLFGINANESQGRYHEALDVILQAWTQDEVTFNGKHFKVDRVKTLPKPVQQPHPRSGRRLLLSLNRSSGPDNVAITLC